MDFGPIRVNALADAGTIPDVQRFARHLMTELPAILSFLVDPALDATNWRAEQAIRPAVITRKMCGGNRSDRGADAQQAGGGVSQARSESPHHALTDARPASRISCESARSSTARAMTMVPTNVAYVLRAFCLRAAFDVPRTIVVSRSTAPRR
jgi:hypothetical protein